MRVPHRRVVIPLSAAVAAALLTSCELDVFAWPDRSDGGKPSPISLPFGRYSVIHLGGDPLPAELFTAGTTTVYLDGDTLRLFPGSTFTRVSHRTQCVAGGPEPVCTSTPLTSSGTYFGVGNRIMLRVERVVADTLTGRSEGNIRFLDLRVDVRVAVFQRDSVG